MAMIPQKNLFSWKKLEKLPDLKQLEILFRNIPDEKLMRKLESNRKKGRDDYPIRAMWNSMLAGVVFDHERIETLRRELKRNPALLEICGFNIFKKGEIIPTAWAGRNCVAWSQTSSVARLCVLSCSPMQPWENMFIPELIKKEDFGRK